MRCRSCAPLPEEVRRAADLLERRWTVSILYVSHEGAVRFNEFQQALGTIPPATLAQRLTDVIIPERNRADLDDIPQDVRDEMSFHPVMSLEEVLELALEPQPAHALS
jgi:DNA-binding HxlR family transcriptional regulator